MKRKRGDRTESSSQLVLRVLRVLRVRRCIGSTSLCIQQEEV